MLFAVAGLAPAFSDQLIEKEPFKDMFSIQATLSNMPNVRYASISANTTTFSSINKGSNTTSYVKVRVFLSNDNISNAKFAHEIAELLLINYPEAMSKDAIQITQTYGYDIGIWSQWLNKTYSFDPDELQSVE